MKDEPTFTHINIFCVFRHIFFATVHLLSPSSSTGGKVIGPGNFSENIYFFIAAHDRDLKKVNDWISTTASTVFYICIKCENISCGIFTTSYEALKGKPALGQI